MTKPSQELFDKVINMINSKADTSSVASKYIKKKLELYNLYFSTRYTQNMPYETVSFKRFGQYAEHEIANNLMFRFYYCLSSMFDNEKTDSLAQLWAILNDGEQQNISKNEQRYIYKGIRNQLTLKVNAKADIETNKELAFLYETLEKKDFLLHKNELSIFQYKQAIIANLRAGNERIEWAYQFMNRNKAFLNPVHQENVYQYCLAYYFFAKKEFETSLKQLEQINEENIVIDKDSLYYIGHYHFLILQNYYELDKLDELLSYILSYKDSLKSNDILPSKIIKKHLNFVSTLNNILKLRKGDQKKGKVYYEKVVETRDVYGRAWLLQKLNLKILLHF